MLANRILCWLTRTLFLLAAAAVHDASVSIAGAADPRFAISATSVDGAEVVVTEQQAARVTVVAFLGIECPLARSYGTRLAQLASEYAARGVRFVGVDSNQQDSVDDIRAYVKEHPTPIPMIRDEGNVIADRYQATRTPEVFVFDHALALKYQGRIDDQYEPGAARAAATRDDLRQAIEDVLADRPVQVPRTTAVGCLIGRLHRPPANPPATEITFSRQVSRVLQRNCVECHRAGEIGPFPLTDYDEVVGWSGAILEAIDAGRMPPWHADPRIGRFANARHISDGDKQILRDWVTSGMPRGDDADLPEPVPTAAGWQLPGDPDVVIPMRNRPFQVPAQGTIEYQYFVVDPHFTEDKWISAAQVVPGSREVVHHAVVFIRPPDGSAFRGVGWLTAYVPGQRLVAMPAGCARRVPAGSKFVFQMHYTANGTPQEDITRLGLTFTDPAEVTHEALTVIGLDQEFEIPPQAANHEVQGEIRWFPQDGTLLAIVPHMHYRGKSFQLVAERQGQSQVLLRVPTYRFDWQHAYELLEPMPLAGIERLRFTAVFDNSAANPLNPDATQWVNWGDQSWEEMAVAFLHVVEPRQTSEPRAKSERVATSSDRDAKIREFIAEFFAKLDTNRDGVVRPAEAPLSVRRVSFRRFDHDDDQRITPDEVRRVAEKIY
jgi:hypothetical protein